MQRAPRQTKARERILHIFQNVPEPLSLIELFRYVRIALPHTAYSTVFRLVQKLEQEGFVHHVDWRERGSRYEWAGMPHHHHIICQVCGMITDIGDTVLNFNETRIREKTGYITKRHSIELEGICPTCQKKQQRKQKK